MKGLFLIVLMTFLIGCMVTKKYSDNFEVKDFYFYKHAHYGGQLFGQAKADFKRAEKKDKIPVDDPDRFKKVLDHSAPNHFVFGKLGGTYVYCDAIASDGTDHMILICDTVFIIDYTQKRYYWVSNKDDKHWLERLVDKVYLRKE
jgi:hypothetical protein